MKPLEQRPDFGLTAHGRNALWAAGRLLHKYDVEVGESMFSLQQCKRNHGPEPSMSLAAVVALPWVVLVSVFSVIPGVTPSKAATVTFTVSVTATVKLMVTMTLTVTVTVPAAVTVAATAV